MIFTKITIPKNDKRSLETINEHYKIEKELASKLLNSNQKERQYLYSSVYDELFRKVPQHPQLTRKSSPEATAWVVTQRMQFLRPFLKADRTFLEVGPGDCSLSIEVANYVKQVYAVDVSNEITKNIVFPKNVQFILSDGRNLPVPNNSVDIAYSHQLMEHLHPDDAIEQLQNIYTALAPNGIYICITPNRLSGPHDISRYFDEIATGFHLKEYTVTELYSLFRQSGFSQVSWVKSKGKINLTIPLNWVTIGWLKVIEGLLSRLPYVWRKKIASTPMLFRGMTIVGVK